eukprot:scaffold170451_cov22-Prasinocladus_malaysianus.AAC.1
MLKNNEWRRKSTPPGQRPTKAAMTHNNMGYMRYDRRSLIALHNASSSADAVSVPYSYSVMRSASAVSVPVLVAVAVPVLVALQRLIATRTRTRTCLVDLSTNSE